MTPADLAAHDATGLAELVRTGAVSAAEVADAALAAIAVLNPALGAVIETWPDEAEAALARLDKAAPFAGVPFLLKDLACHAAGRPSESGSRLCAGMALPHDSFLMARFRRAGLVPLGRTKSPEFGFSSTCEPVAHGKVHNPWDPGRSPGGSSGGSAAAVAARMVPIAHAKDAGGSIRIPAAACGLVGLKPSRGRVSMGPDMGEALFGFAAELCVSRSVRDTARLLDAVHGPEPGDPYGIAPPARPYAEELGQPVRGLRVAVMRTALDGSEPVPLMADVLARAAALCAELGMIVEEAAPSTGVPPDMLLEAVGRIWCASLAAGIDMIARATGRPTDATMLEAGTLLVLDWGRQVTTPELLEALGICNMVSRSVAPFFATHDVLLSPTLPGPAQPLGLFDTIPPGLDGRGWVRWLFATTPYTAICNITGQPAISLPLFETPEGLPLGLQFAAAMGREDLLLRLASAFEQALPWVGRRPKLLAA